MEGRGSKEYSWKWVDTDKTLLSHGSCDFLYAKLTPDSEAGSCILYDGENDNGETIVELRTSGLYNCEANPCVPIYCRRGLYVGSLTDAGVLVQWRERGHGKEH